MRLETLLQQAQRPLLIAHIAPDGDCIGSLLGLGWALREVGKQPTLACADPVPEGLRFLPGSDGIVAQAAGNEDLIVSLDSSDLQRLGRLYDESLFAHLAVINIDHHVTNTRFGTEQLLEPTAASTAQIVYDLLRRLAWPVSPWTATCLLTGLITDTRSFRTANTDAKALRTALALTEAGAPLPEINQHLTHNLSFGLVRLWGSVLSGIQFTDGVAWAEVTLEMLRESGAGSSDTAGLVNFIAGIREARIALLLVERPDGQVEIGMRSVPGVDVSEVALALGGGGHRQAAGCTLAGPLPAVREAVLRRLLPLLATIPAPLPEALGGTHVARAMSLPAE